MRRIVVDYIIPLCFSLGLLELLSFAAVEFLQSKMVFYNPPPVGEYERYLEERDPVLGWPSKTQAKERLDYSGSRPMPAFPTPGTACVSLYGDSFTWSDPVDDEHAWGNVLGQKLNCRVANYGYGAYGNDQALLRFQLNEHDESGLVVLNHFPGDIRRNVNQMRNLLSAKERLTLKPRFVLENGALKLIPIPAPSKEQALELVEDPAKFLNHEFFLPGGPSHIRRISFPYTLSLLSVYQNEHIGAKMQGKAVWDLYHEASHPSGALQLTTAIFKEFVDLAHNRGKQAVVTVIPNAHDIENFKEFGHWGFQPLIDALAEYSIPVLNFGPGVIEYVGDRNICEITEKNICYGHYNEEGY
ncbi:MAG: hypothetical protein KDD62_12700, partial [Bdellovibrionales bacterium]|nr:hypothetical protein [Bdellovibrionales bacterium]